MDGDQKIFPATLARKDKLITYLVGFGVWMGVPTVLGASFAFGFQEPWLLLFPLPFVLTFGVPYFFRPLGFVVTNTVELGLTNGSRIIISPDDFQGFVQTVQHVAAPCGLMDC